MPAAVMPRLDAAELGRALRAGIDPATVRGKGHASKLLSLYFGSQLEKLGMASPSKTQRITIVIINSIRVKPRSLFIAQSFFRFTPL